MLLKPKNTKYKKAFKGRMITSHKKQSFCFGEYALISLETSNFTAGQIFAAKLAIQRKIKKDGRIFTRVFPHLPVSKKPSEVRMGKGKGAVDHYIARVSPGSFIFELITSNKFLANAALSACSAKLPFKTFVCHKTDIAILRKTAVEPIEPKVSL